MNELEWVVSPARTLTLYVELIFSIDIISSLFNLYDLKAFNYVDKCASLCISIYKSRWATNIENFTTTIKNSFKQKGYYLDGNLMDSHIKLQLGIISKSDLGITLLMMFFAKFISADRYEIFVYTFRYIDEFKYFETFLLSLQQETIKLPDDMATDEKYGLMKNKDAFINNNFLTVEKFNEITHYMKSVNASPEHFIQTIKNLHSSIIESFFMFTSMNGMDKRMEDCHKILIHQNEVL